MKTHICYMLMKMTKLQTGEFEKTADSVRLDLVLNNVVCSLTRSSCLSQSACLVSVHKGNH